ncbi:MAG: TlpA family protein disulfide reductase [Saprospiraceae bacterium]|nr:TlpA family protein disulfide reductase [Saprospiraceae bacterium]
MKEAFIVLICLFCNFDALICQSEYEKLMDECKEQGFFESQECMIGKEIPEFNGITYEGRQIGNSTIKNKIGVINFWFMACPPCMAELDGLNAVVEHYKERSDIEFISFTTDDKQDIIEGFLPFHQLKFEIIPDAENTISEVFKSWWGFPTTIIIDKSGKIHKIFSGGMTDEKEASKEIERTLIRLIDECLEK